MGLFHDTCQTLVSIATGKALKDAELAEAQALMNSTPASFGRRKRALKERGWRICDNAVSKRARVCNKCGARAPGGWVKCPVCHKWIGNESRFCPHCDTPLHPEERVSFAGGIWDREPGEFAHRFEIMDMASIMKNGIHVQEGSVAILLDSGKVVGVMGAGRHDPDSVLRKINWFGNPPPRSAVMADSGEVVIRVDFDKLRTAEEKQIRMVAEITLRLIPSRADDFIANILKNTRVVSMDDIRELIYNECNYAATNLCNKSTIEDLVKDPERRTIFEDELSRTVKDLFKRIGLELVRVGYVDFSSAEYEEERKGNEELDIKRRKYEFDQKMTELVAAKAVAELEQANAEKDRATEKKEYEAKKAQELEEYIAQLAQEKGLSEIDRKVEMEIASRFAKSKISSKEAEFELVALQEENLREMAALSNHAAIRKAQEDFDREEQLRKAEHRALLAQKDREEAQLDAEHDVTIYGIRKVGEAKVEAEVADIARETAGKDSKAAVEKAKDDEAISKSATDAEMYNATEALKLRKIKQEQELDAEERRAKMVRGLSAMELAAMQKDSGISSEYLKLAEKQLQAGMTPEQILATLSANEGSSEALKALYGSKNASQQEVMEAMRKMYEQGLQRDDKMMDRYAQMLEHISGMMSETASTAARRVDPAPQNQQQIVK